MLGTVVQPDNIGVSGPLIHSDTRQLVILPSVSLRNAGLGVVCGTFRELHRFARVLCDNT